MCHLGTPTCLSRPCGNWLSTKVELLDSLAADYRTYISELSELELSNHKLAGQISKSSEYIGEHVLWIRSTGPIGTDYLRKAAGGAIALAQLGPWFEVAKCCGLDVLRRPMIAMSVCSSWWR